MVIQIGSEESAWQVVIAAQRRNFELRFPFFGSVGYFKQGPCLCCPWEFERVSWATCRKWAGNFKTTTEHLWVEHILEPGRRAEREAERLRYAQEAGLA